MLKRVVRSKIVTVGDGWEEEAVGVEVGRGFPLEKVKGIECLVIRCTARDESQWGALGERRTARETDSGSC